MAVPFGLAGETLYAMYGERQYDLYSKVSHAPPGGDGDFSMAISARDEPWIELVREQGDAAERLAREVPAALMGRSVTTAEVEGLHRSLTKQAAIARELVASVRQAGASSDLVEAAQAVSKIYAALVGQTAIRMAELRAGPSKPVGRGFFGWLTGKRPRIEPTLPSWAQPPAEREEPTLDDDTGEDGAAALIQVRMEARRERTFRTKVNGVSYANRDGSSRQDAIRRCREGDPLDLRHEPDNPHGEHAIGVWSTRLKRQLGYIPSQIAERLLRQMRESQVVAEVAEILDSGDDDIPWGILIAVTVVEVIE